MKILRRVLPGIIVLGVGFSIASVIIFFGPEPESQKSEVLARTIRSIEAKSSNIQLFVESQGTVAAKQVIDVVSQVAGEIIFVSPNFVAGGRFKKGEIIAKIDPSEITLLVGLKIIKTPIKPVSIAVHLRQPNFSPKKGTDKPATMRG